MRIWRKKTKVTKITLEKKQKKQKKKTRKKHCGFFVLLLFEIILSFYEPGRHWMGLQALNMQFFLKFRFVFQEQNKKHFYAWQGSNLQQTFFLESKISDIVQKANFLWKILLLCPFHMWKILRPKLVWFERGKISQLESSINSR